MCKRCQVTLCSMGGDFNIVLDPDLLKSSFFLDYIIKQAELRRHLEE